MLEFFSILLCVIDPFIHFYYIFLNPYNKISYLSLKLKFQYQGLFHSIPRRRIEVFLSYSISKPVNLFQNFVYQFLFLFLFLGSFFIFSLFFNRIYCNLFWLHIVKQILIFGHFLLQFIFFLNYFRILRSTMSRSYLLLQFVNFCLIFLYFGFGFNNFIHTFKFVQL